MSPHTRARFVALAFIVLLLAGCAGLIETAPSPTPLDFPGIAGELAKRGIAVAGYRSGDPGCADKTLVPTAYSFDAAGLDQTARTRLRVYVFADKAAFDRRRADVDTCAAAWATDPATFEFVDASPFVIAGQGPWPPRFHAALRDALVAAAGSGGSSPSSSLDGSPPPPSASLR
jgi:hypothetical protein